MERVIFRRATVNDIPQLIALHSMLFPVPYEEAHIKGFLDEYALVAVLKNTTSEPIDTSKGDFIIGVLTARVQPVESFCWLSDETYIMTFGTHPDYRHKGIATALMEHFLDEIGSKYSSVSLHVKEGNEGALEFYKKKGFSVVEVIYGYYRWNKEERAKYSSNGLFMRKSLSSWNVIEFLKSLFGYKPKKDL